jgi:hypothetical protein
MESRLKSNKLSPNWNREGSSRLSKGKVNLADMKNIDTWSDSGQKIKRKEKDTNQTKMDEIQESIEGGFRQYGVIKSYRITISSRIKWRHSWSPCKFIL